MKLLFCPRGTEHKEPCKLIEEVSEEEIFGYFDQAHERVFTVEFDDGMTIDATLDELVVVSSF